MKNIFKKTLSLIFASVLCSVFILPLSVSAKTIKHIDDITETYEFEFCCVIPQISLFDEDELEELNELVKDTAEEINMYVCVILGTSIYNDTQIEEFAELFYDDIFGPNTDGIIYYIDLSGRSESYDYISTSGRAALVYTDYENDGYNNRIDDIFDNIYLPKSGATIEASDIANGIEEFCKSLEEINEKGPKKFYYSYDKYDEKYIYLKGDDVVVSSKKPLYAIINYTPIGLITMAIVTLISVLTIKGSYKFKTAFNSSSYVERNKTVFNVKTDTFIREYTRRVKIDSGGGGGRRSGGGRRGGGGSHGGGGRHR